MKIKFIKLMVSVTILMPVLFSCSGGSGSSDAPLFGSIPGEYEKFQAEKDKISEEAKNIKSESDKAKLIEKSEKMKEEWSAKFEKSAKALDGQPIEFAESNLKVTKPISLEFVKISGKSNPAPEFKINGSAEAAREIKLDFSYVLPSQTVYIVGYNAEGEQLYKIRAGSIAVENVDGMAVVKAGTPVEFNNTFYFNTSYVKEYMDTKTLKLEILR